MHTQIIPNYKKLVKENNCIMNLLKMLEQQKGIPKHLKLIITEATKITEKEKSILSEMNYPLHVMVSDNKDYVKLVNKINICPHCFSDGSKERDAGSNCDCLH